jgi:hypothetical protein
MSNLYWEIFKLTGSVDAFLCMNEYKDLDEYDEAADSNVQVRENSNESNDEYRRNSFKGSQIQ